MNQQQWSGYIHENVELLRNISWFVRMTETQSIDSQEIIEQALKIDQKTQGILLSPESRKLLQQYTNHLIQLKKTVSEGQINVEDDYVPCEEINPLFEEYQAKALRYFEYKGL